MKIPFICVNYNSEEETIKYIDNIFTLDNSNVAFIIIVDNSPTLNSYEIIKTYIEAHKLENTVTLIRCENKGYFHGLNIGIKEAKKNNKTLGYMVVGNNDILFEKNFIKNLIHNKYQDDVLVIAPDIITTEGSHENPHVLHKMSRLRILKYDLFFSNYYLGKFFRLLKPSERPMQKHDPIGKNIYMGIGALYVLTPTFFKHFSELWDYVFLYGEEAILTGQINSVNGKIFYDPSLICFHNESSTTGKMEKKSKYEIVQNSYKIYRKYL